MADFQLKDFVSIVAAMLNHAKATQNDLTDFEVGSVVRTILEAPGIEIEELYQRMFAGIGDAIPTSIYKAFGFELIGEASASGSVHVTFAGPIVDPFVIPAGTVFAAPSVSLKFVSSDDVTVSAGATSASVVVVCQTPGTVGNVGAGTITAALNFQLPVGATVANPAFNSGRNAQSESERKARFAEFMTSLSRGTPPALRYAVRQAKVTSPSGVLLEYVARVGIVEHIGRVEVFIYGSSGLPSADLLGIAQQIVDGYKDPDTGELVPGYRAGGIQVSVLPMAEREIDVSLRVTPMFGVTPSPDAENEIATVLASTFDGIESGETLFVEAITDAALTVPGIQKVLSANDENVLCADNEVLRLGDLDIQWVANA